MKVFRVQMVALNWCSRCTRTINKDETAWRFDGNYVCSNCYRG